MDGWMDGWMDYYVLYLMFASFKRRGGKKTL
jgi:hypothetical protein